MNNTFASIFPPVTTSLIAILATTVSTATLGGNIVVLIAFFVERSLRVPSNYFIASLAMTDVLIGLFSMNLFITYQLLGYWPLGHLICDLWLSLDFSACLTSQYTVFLITLDRFCSVKIPAKYRNWRTFNKVRVMICISWIFPAALFTPVIFGWSYLTGEPEREIVKCEVSFTYYPVFNTTLTIGYFWTTLVIMCSLYVGIYKVARRLQAKSIDNNKRLMQFLSKIDNKQILTQQNTSNNTNSLDDDDDGDDNDNDVDNVEKVKRKNTQNNIQLSNDQCFNSNCLNKYPTNSNNDVAGYLTNQTYCLNKTTKDMFKESNELADCNFMNQSNKINGIDKIQLYSLTTVSQYQRTSPKNLKQHHPHHLGIGENESVSQQSDQLQRGYQYENKTSNDCSVYHNSDSILNTSQTHQTSISTTATTAGTTAHEDKQADLHRKDSLSSLNDEIFSLPSVNFYIPSPKVSTSSPIQSDQSLSPKYTYSENNSPVWIRKKDNCYDSGLNLYECDLCPQVLKCQQFISDKNFCENGVYYYLSDSPSWDQCPPTCCLTDKCEYSEYTTSSGNMSSMYNNQLTNTNCWYRRFMHRLNKPNNMLIKSVCTLSKQQSPSSLCKSCDDKPYPCGLQNNYNNNQDICPCYYYSSNNNNSKNFIQQHRESQISEEPTKLQSKCLCCILPPKQQISADLNNNHTQGQTSLSNSQVQSPNNSDDYMNVQNGQQKNKSNKLSLKYKQKQQRFNSQQHQQYGKSSTSTTATTKPGRRQTSLSIFQSLSNIDAQNRKHARKALKTISFILGAFMICWTPYHIIVLIKGFCDDLATHTSCVNIHLYNLSYWLCYMNSPINPFCYALSNISFRRTFFRILRCDFQKR
ncbi:unnamed protein product [Trichobilharzia szidati]|nr:unnamed protein product [Trichobilharzia szidati]